jgi:hypothetical protein
MRAKKGIALGLVLLLAAGSATACTSLRTPYERTKMAENGGAVKKQDEGGGDKKKGGQGGGEGGKGSDAGASSAPKEDKVGQAKAAEAKKKPSQPGRAETVGEKEERLKGQGLLYLGNQKLGIEQPGRTKPQEMKKADESKPTEGADLAYHKKMSVEVAKLEGVDSATVLLDTKHNAYVALTAADTEAPKGDDQPAVKSNDKLKVKTEGNVSQSVQEKIAEKLRSMDSEVGTVNITANPNHVKSFQRYTTDLQNGETGIKTQALSDHIQDIWKR